MWLCALILDSKCKMCWWLLVLCEIIIFLGLIESLKWSTSNDIIIFFHMSCYWNFQYYIQNFIGRVEWWHLFWTIWMISNLWSSGGYFDLTKCFCWIQNMVTQWINSCYSMSNVMVVTFIIINKTLPQGDEILKTEYL